MLTCHTIFMTFVIIIMYAVLPANILFNTWIFNKIVAKFTQFDVKHEILVYGYFLGQAETCLGGNFGIHVHIKCPSLPNTDIIPQRCTHISRHMGTCCSDHHLFTRNHCTRVPFSTKLSLHMGPFFFQNFWNFLVFPCQTSK